MRIFRNENYKLLCINFTEIEEVFIIENNKVKESESISPRAYENIVKQACYIETINIDFNIIKNIYKGRLVLTPIDINDNPRRFIVFYLRGKYFKIKIENESGEQID